jgi:hypothetical protein
LKITILETILAMKKILPILLLTLTLFSCKKDKPAPPAVTIPVKFTGTTYKTLGPYDNNGKPVNMEAPDAISNGLLNFLHTTLPERTNLETTHPELLSSSAIGDIVVTQKTELHATFVSEGALYANAIAFYTYPTNSPPASAADIRLITYIFPNAGANTTLVAGSKVDIGSFDAGTSVGFVLMKNAWDGSVKSLNTDVVHYCSDDVLNPEVDPKLKKHAVLLDYAPESKTLIGFEDVDRTYAGCDNDFNDVVFYISKSTPK